jgi:hypothetical protein
VILAAHDVRHFHQRIVDHDCIVVGRNAIRTNEHRIANHLGVKRDASTHEVVERDFPAGRYAQSNDSLFARGHTRGGLLFRDGAASAGILRRQPLLQHRLPIGFELLG